MGARQAAGRSERLAYADSLRGGAAFCVAIFAHYIHFTVGLRTGASDMEGMPFFGNLIVRTLYYYSYLAVDFFYILSGIIFASIYGRGLHDGSVGGWTFFLRRFSRLYPIHLLTLCLTAVLVYAFHARMGRFPVYQKNGAWDFIVNLLMLQDGVLSLGFSFNGPAFSISVEAMLYVWFFLMARRGWLRGWAWLSIAAGIALFLTSQTPVWRDVFPAVGVARGLIGFALGLMIAGVGGRREPYIALAALLALAVMPGTGGLIGLPFAASWCVFALLLLALPHWRLGRRLLEFRVLTWLGDISLSMYLIHFPLQVAIMLALDRLGLPIPYTSPLFLLAYAVLVPLVAAPLHFWFERPAQSWLRRRLDRGQGQRAR